MAGIACQQSEEYNMASINGESQYAGGSPAGGYPITLVGTGFDGYDGNASNVRVRFRTVVEPPPTLNCTADATWERAEINGTLRMLWANGSLAEWDDANGTSPMPAAGDARCPGATVCINGTCVEEEATAEGVYGAMALTDGAHANATGANGTNGSLAPTGATAEYIEVNAISLSATRVVVLAPRVSLSEGEIYTTRGYPCWNPPCRRTEVSLAINGVDFVGRPETPLVFFFYDDPFRFLYLAERELYIVLIMLGLLSFCNAMVTWRFRFEVYERYLKFKYQFKNRVLFPLTNRASRRHVRMLEMEGQKLDFNAGHKYGAPAKRPRRSKAKEVALTPVSGPPPTSSTADLSV
jgi:hypothetical protein